MLTGHSIRETDAAPRPDAHDATGVARPPVNAVFILWLRPTEALFSGRAPG